MAKYLIRHEGDLHILVRSRRTLLLDSVVQMSTLTSRFFFFFFFLLSLFLGFYLFISLFLPSGTFESLSE